MIQNLKIVFFEYDCVYALQVLRLEGNGQSCHPFLVAFRIRITSTLGRLDLHRLNSNLQYFPFPGTLKNLQPGEIAIELIP